MKFKARERKFLSSFSVSSEEAEPPDSGASDTEDAASSSGENSVEDTVFLLYPYHTHSLL
jgi:hypothetical protein